MTLRQLVTYIANGLLLSVSALLEEQLFSLIINYTCVTLLHIREYMVETQWLCSKQHMPFIR